MEQTVKITWEGEEKDVVLGKELTWGECKEISQKSIVIKEYNGMPMQFRNTELQDDLYLLAVIKSAPFEVKMENLDKLSPKDRNELIKCANASKSN